MARHRFLCSALLVACGVCTIGPAEAPAQGPQPGRWATRPERTEYRETSRYDEVIALLKDAAAASALVHITTFGYSHEGRPLPLAVVGRLPDGRAETVRASNRLRVYVQANVHGGEVDGKEAMLALVRDIAQGQAAPWMDRVVLLLAPIYNPDGNERVTLMSRPLQHGPVGGVGERANAQGLNINRDYIKLETPEARAMVRLMNDYDPHVLVDLHTTNGSRHAYHLTYETPNHPTVHAPLAAFARQEWMPAVARAFKAKFDWEIRSYGNVEGTGDDRTWTTVEDLPRYSHNYWGLRNRIGVLSESYSYATFADRIAASLRFVREVLSFARERAPDIAQYTAAADAAAIVGQRLALRSAGRRSAERAIILMGDVAETINPYSGRPMLRRLDVRRPESMWEQVAFEPLELERVPSAYFVPRELTAVIQHLQAHGVRVEPLAAPETHDVERFRITGSTLAERSFENHRERQVTGRYETARRTFAAGTWRVPMTQPLARLAFMLLEPRSADGLVTWNLLDPAMDGREEYPILRTHK